MHKFASFYFFAATSRPEKISTVTLVKEMHGTGYISQPQVNSEFPSDCYRYSDAMRTNFHISIAFSANGQWDSKNGANFINLHDGDLAGSEVRLEDFNTNTNGSDVNLPAWDFIIGQMRK